MSKYLYIWRNSRPQIILTPLTSIRKISLRNKSSELTTTSTLKRSQKEVGASSKRNIGSSRDHLRWSNERLIPSWRGHSRRLRVLPHPHRARGSLRRTMCTVKISPWSTIVWARWPWASFRTSFMKRIYTWCKRSLMRKWPRTCRWFSPRNVLGWIGLLLCDPSSCSYPFPSKRYGRCVDTRRKACAEGPRGQGEFLGFRVGGWWGATLCFQGEQGSDTGWDPSFGYKQEVEPYGSRKRMTLLSPRNSSPCSRTRSSLSSSKASKVSWTNSRLIICSDPSSLLFD